MKISFTDVRHEKDIPEPLDLRVDPRYPEWAFADFEILMILDDERPTGEPHEVWIEVAFHFERQSDKTWRRTPLMGDRRDGEVRDIHDMKWDRYEDDVRDRHVMTLDALFETPEGMDAMLEKRRADAIALKIAGLEDEIEKMRSLIA